MAGFHSLAEEADTATGLENLFPCRVAAKIAALPLRHPCHATQTLPFESVVAAGSISEPGELERRSSGPGLPSSMLRAQRSKFPFWLTDQKTHARPEPSTAMAGR